MTGHSVLDSIGFDRVKQVNSGDDNISESELYVMNQVKDFGINSIYFNTDENDNSHPAVFFKKVESFDNKSLESIAQTQRDIWNYKKVLFLYVYSDFDIRIYNCSEKPLIKTNSVDYESEIKELEIKSYSLSDLEQVQELTTIFSRYSIDSGTIWTLEEAREIREKLNLRKRVDRYLVSSLVDVSQQLKSQGLELKFINKLILRSLFLLYLEDRGATNKTFYSNIKDGANSYFDILNDVEATYILFQRLDKHFNGNVFTLDKNESVSKEQLHLIRKCFISGYDDTSQLNLFENWRIFDFSIIQIELLSEIYENFLFKTDPELKKKSGTYYTPPSLVEFILNEKLPVNNGETNFSVKILDPSCGSGIFLVESFRRLVKRHENSTGQKLTDFNKLKELLTANIFGIELHPQATKVAAFSLYLALVDCLNPKTIWQDGKNRLPYLINNPDDSSLKQQGNNLFCRDTISVNTGVDNIRFDLVVGNPPFGNKGLLDSIGKYCSENKFAKEMVLPFLHKAATFSPSGEIALIFNTKVLTNTGGTYQNFRNWLFKECYVEKIYNFSILRNAPTDFGGQLFGDATGPISIVYYQRIRPEKPNDYITYYSPKTYIKSNVVEGLVIDFTDVKFLPREECEKPNSKIWKIAMWGGMRDWNLINRLKASSESFKSYLTKNKIDFGSGLHPKENDKNKVLVNGHHIETRKIQPYYTGKSITNYIESEFRKININLFKKPLVLIKEGITARTILSSFFDYDVFYNKAVYGFSAKEEDATKLRAISILLNSKLARYYFFLSSSSWGLERDRVVLREYLNFPYKELDSDEISKLDFANTFFAEDVNLLDSEKTKFDFNYWDLKIKELYKLSASDVELIEDTINMNIDLFHSREKSKAMFPVNKNILIEYCSRICNELDNFLEGQEVYVNSTIFKIDRYSSLMMIVISFDESSKSSIESSESVAEQLGNLDKYLWEEKASNIYFRKKLNYKTGKHIYLVRPNQRRFWSKSMAREDASELILEILNEN